MTEPELQGQHRISQVYLKQFGYKNADKWYISVWRKFLNKTGNELIETFSKEINIFDLPYEDFKLRRHFENSSNIIEGEYPKVINTIKNQHQLIPKHKDVLCHYVANLICRAKPYREFFDLLLKDEQTRNKFLAEIKMFDEEELPKLKQLLEVLTENFQLNIAIGALMNHLVRIFRKFNFVILRDFNNRGWLTSDNPVIVDKKENYSWIVPIETEIYFPLSKDFCLFMFHTNSRLKENPLRHLKINKVTMVDEAIHKNIWDMVSYNENQYLIFPAEIEQTFFNHLEQNGA